MLKQSFLDQMTDSYSKVTVSAALRAYLKIQELHSSYQEEPPKEVTDSWKALIDEAAVAGMGEILSKIPFRTISVGSEGAKEILAVGKAAPSVVGEHGDLKYPAMEMVSDAVEGTTPASRREPGASSVVAVVKKPEKGFGIRQTPKDIHYLMKFIGPAQAKGVVDLNRPYKENLKDLIKVLGIEPKELTQVTMNPKKINRDANLELVAAAEDLGVKLKLIDVGDFMPSVRASISSARPVIVATRGGYEEGIMAAAAAKALGGFMQAIEFNKDNLTYEGNPVLTLEKDLVQASLDEILVSATFITGENLWLNQPGIRKNGQELELTTVLISQQGISFHKTTTSLKSL